MNCVTKMRRKLLSEHSTAVGNRTCTTFRRTRTHYPLTQVPWNILETMLRECVPLIECCCLPSCARSRLIELVFFFFVQLFGEASCGILFIKCLWWKLPSLVFVVLRFSCACCIANKLQKKLQKDENTEAMRSHYTHPNTQHTKISLGDLI